VEAGARERALRLGLEGPQGTPVRDAATTTADSTGKGRGGVRGRESQIQALDCTAPILRLRPGLPESRTHDYVRHGTTTLWAALEVATGN
jgi:hypothetical protein